jgi:CheY-like chemotaxis protein
MVRVFVVCGETVFGHGVERLLHPEAGVEVVGRESNSERAMQRITELQPDVILLDGSSLQNDPTPALMRFLRDQPGTKIIGLNLQNNCVCIYSGEQRVIKDVGDLVGAITESVAEPVSRERLDGSDLHEASRVTPARSAGKEGERD